MGVCPELIEVINQGPHYAWNAIKSKEWMYVSNINASKQKIQSFFAYPSISNFKFSKNVLRHVVFSHWIHNKILISCWSLTWPILMAFILKKQYVTMTTEIQKAPGNNQSWGQGSNLSCSWNFAVIYAPGTPSLNSAVKLKMFSLVERNEGKCYQHHEKLKTITFQF